MEFGLRDRAGNIHSTRGFNDKTTAFFVAGANCPGTRIWVPELAENGWRIGGLQYDRLVFLAVSDRALPVPTGLPQYKVEWPMPGYLSSCTMYPAVYVVSEDGVFTGFKLGRVGAPIVADESK
ncbi:MAG: peroxiredoxin family protein [Acidobacteria bacterium]|nr:peroxiredoxin family protein [Acidobacteriota bacterium]